MRRWLVIVALALAAASVIACASGPQSSTAPSTVAGPAMVPPLPGVPPAVYVLQCAQDNRVYLPEGTVHMNLAPAFLTSASDLKWFADLVAAAVGFGNIPIDLTPVAGGVNYPVTLNAALQTAAFTDPDFDQKTGRIKGGTMEFVSIEAFHDGPTVMRELFRATGVVRTSSEDGLFGPRAWREPRPSSAEALMLLARPRLTPLAFCTN